MDKRKTKQLSLKLRLDAAKETLEVLNRQYHRLVQGKYPPDELDNHQLRVIDAQLQVQLLELKTKEMET